MRRKKTASSQSITIFSLFGIGKIRIRLAKLVVLNKDMFKALDWRKVLHF